MCGVVKLYEFYCFWMIRVLVDFIFLSAKSLVRVIPHYRVIQLLHSWNIRGYNSMRFLSQGVKVVNILVNATELQ